jgi:LysM repeat protein
LIFRNPRIPKSCPEGFEGGYTVVKGDTMFLIAKRLGIPLEELIEANPHITNPHRIYPGDVLCIPFQMVFPCCVIMGASHPYPPLPLDAWGVALTRLIEMETQQTVSILAVGLDSPSKYGSFDTYEGFVEIPNIGGFGFPLYPTPETPSTWAGTLTIGTFLTPATIVKLRPASSKTGKSGSDLLVGALNLCTT